MRGAQLGIRHAALLCAALAVPVLSAGAAAPRRPQDGQVRVNRDAQLIAEFSQRAAAYADTHRTLERTLPSQPDRPSPEQVDAHQRALARLISRARSEAGPGDLFTRECRAYFRRQIRRALSGPDGADLKGVIMDDNPGRIQLQINGRYPDDAPVSTMPTQVLAMLPVLPPELEYRFIGDRLILLDVHAHLVVDYIDNALPR